MDGAAATVRSVEVALRAACPSCGAEIEAYGPHLGVTCVCGHRVGLATAVVAAPLHAFDDEGPESGQDTRGGVTWRWSTRASRPACAACGAELDPASPPAACACGAAVRSVDAPPLLVAQVPGALRVVGGDGGERSSVGGPRWWVVLDGPGRAARRRAKEADRRQRERALDAQRLEEFQRSQAEAERYKAELDARRIRERDEHERASLAVLGLSWLFVLSAAVGMSGTTSLVMMDTALAEEPIIVVFTRLLLVGVGMAMGVFGLVASSAAAAYRVHEPLQAYVGFSMLVAFGASIPGIGFLVAAVFAARLALGRDPTLRGVRRTTPGGGRPMAVALVAYCVTVQLGVASIWGSTFQEIFSVLSEDLARVLR